MRNQQQTMKNDHLGEYVPSFGRIDFLFLFQQPNIRKSKHTKERDVTYAHRGRCSEPKFFSW